jgi:hypothetical protein
MCRSSLSTSTLFVWARPAKAQKHAANMIDKCLIIMSVKALVFSLAIFAEIGQREKPSGVILFIYQHILMR